MTEEIKYYCYISGEVIPQARVEYLLTSGLPVSLWTVVTQSRVKKKKGIFSGEVGTSELLVVDKVYEDTVRSVFREADKEAREDEVGPDEDINVKAEESFE